MKEEYIIWPISPHTEMKHFILKKYLGAWLPIISRSNKRVIFIDGFAGPGEYKEGNDGSPIIALKALIDHKLELLSEFIFIFIEKEKDRCTHLEQVISKINKPEKANIKFNVKCGEFRDVITKILDDLDGKRMAPTFLFIDPFGFSGVPMEQIKRFMKNKKCEVLITFMLDEMIRFCNLPQNDKNLTELFGSEEWKRITNDSNLSSEERSLGLHNLYLNQLKNVSDITFVRSFKMINQFNKTDYFLFFGTNSLLGLEKMKEAMWSVDPRGKFTFSDATYDPKQTLLFSLGPNYVQLEKEILSEFNKKKVTIEQIDEFVIAKTSYLRKHRKKVLDDLERDKKIKVSCNKKRRIKTYPQNCTEIEFL
ncbi:MAG: three-Cys-motif partner protein TcmP [Nanoarchaeota archaeon]|nr:three-Cys-motif partner protein TcmP [Nanoarchaeota archaeon]